MFALLEVLSLHLSILLTLLERLDGEIRLGKEAPRLHEGKLRKAADRKDQSQT